MSMGEESYNSYYNPFTHFITYTSAEGKKENFICTIEVWE